MFNYYNQLSTIVEQEEEKELIETLGKKDGNS